MTKQEEYKEWFEKYYKDSRISIKELVKEFNKQFRTNKSEQSLKGLASKYQIKKNLSFRSYKEDQREWLKENFFKYAVNKDLIEAFNKQFNCKVDRKSLLRVCWDMGLNRNHKNGGKFQYGERTNSQRYHPIGSEVKYNNVIWIKINDIPFHKGDSYKESFRKNWVVKKAYLYEQYHNVKLTSNDLIINLDGDIYNFNKDNLERITRSENVQLNKMGAYGKGELTKAALSIIRCKNIINEMKG